MEAGAVEAGAVEAEAGLKKALQSGWAGTAQRWHLQRSPTLPFLLALVLKLLRSHESLFLMVYPQ